MTSDVVDGKTTDNENKSSAHKNHGDHDFKTEDVSEKLPRDATVKGSVQDNVENEQNHQGGKALSEKKETAGSETKQDEVIFKSKKRSKKRRRKREGRDSEDVVSDEDTDKVMSRSDMLLLREAQQMREQNRRRTAVGTLQSSLERSREKKTSDIGEDVLDSLGNSFAAERSGVAMEERMEKYIMDGLHRKFGDEKFDISRRRDLKKSEEDALYDVPEHLQVEQRPMYDPGEGLPNAGVEEVEIPLEEQQKTIEQTGLAIQDMREKKTSRSDEVESQTTGNVNSNFVQNYQDFAETHAEVMTSFGDKNDVEKLGEIQIEQKEDRKRVRHSRLTATDSLVEERFRKRWKK